MRTLFWSRAALVWAVLLFATLFSWAIGHGVGTGSAAGACIGIVCVSLVKVYLVMAEFMELREAPPAALWVVRGWLVALGVALLWLYFR